MKIVALIENNICEDSKEAYGCELTAEHGLAIYIEYEGRNYLLDTGSSNLFSQNADNMGIDLSTIDVGILSHAHYDHSGGYDEFFKRNEKAKVYVRKEAFEKCYIKAGPVKRYIGIPEGILDANADRFVYVGEDCQIDEGVWLIAHKDRDLKMRAKKAHMYRQTSTGWLIDDFKHEQSLVFETNEGLVILNSCCHGGVDTIIEEVKEAFPDKKVKAMIGGFHLMGLTGAGSMAGKPEEIRALADKLKVLGVEEIYTGHCTGEPAYHILKEELGNRLQYFGTGCIVEY